MISIWWISTTCKSLNRPLSFGVPSIILLTSRYQSLLHQAMKGTSEDCVVWQFHPCGPIQGSTACHTSGFYDAVMEPLSCGRLQDFVENEYYENNYMWIKKKRKKESKKKLFFSTAFSQGLFEISLHMSSREHTLLYDIWRYINSLAIFTLDLCMHLIASWENTENGIDVVHFEYIYLAR